MRASAVRRALLALLALAAIAGLLSACGGSGESSQTSVAALEREEDAVVLNEILSRQNAAAEAYAASLRAAKGRALALAGLFRAQEQEHVDGILKALRGLGAKVEPVAEPIEPEDLRSERDHLRFFYEIESATIEAETTAIAKLNAPSSRALLAGTVANQAQHLVLLRRALGVRPLATVPSPFENGTTPAP